MTVHDLPSRERLHCLQAAARDSIAGGRIYDSHIVEIARAAQVRVIVTDTRRHFLSAVRHAGPDAGGVSRDHA